MNQGKSKSKRRSRVEPQSFRSESVVWPPELPWPPEGNETAEKFEEAIKKLNEEETAKTVSNPEYIPIHRILLLPPEGGVPPATLPSPDEDPSIDAFCEILAGIVARILREGHKSQEDTVSNFATETDK